MGSGANARSTTPLSMKIYKDLKGWECDLTRLSNINDAPKELHDYINWLEKTLEVPIKIVSVGPDRIQTLSR